MDYLAEALKHDIPYLIRTALREDIRGGTGDISAQLIPAQQMAEAHVISRQAAVICGCAWVDEVFRQLDPRVQLQWHVADGDEVQAEQCLLTLQGPTRSLLTGERTALNCLQCLSSTATLARHYAQRVAHTKVILRDTRKTLPGLRSAQKYAVRCGGCANHRYGLFDAFLIKENHIIACGSIAAAVQAARALATGKPVMVEVETLAELAQALVCEVDTVLLDNFTLADLRAAVQMNDTAIELEASGGVTEETLVATAETDVDAISIGALTKHCQAIDLSMRLMVK